MFLHCPMPSTCPSPLSTHSWHRRLMSFTARRMVPRFCCNTSTSCSILCCKSCRLHGGVTNTLSFRYPLRKKSHGVRSGDLGAIRFHWVIDSNNPLIEELSEAFVNCNEAMSWGTILSPPNVTEDSVLSVKVEFHLGYTHCLNSCQSS